MTTSQSRWGWPLSLRRFIEIELVIFGALWGFLLFSGSAKRYDHRLLLTLKVGIIALVMSAFGLIYKTLYDESREYKPSELSHLVNYYQPLFQFLFGIGTAVIVSLLSDLYAFTVRTSEFTGATSLASFSTGVICLAIFFAWYFIRTFAELQTLIKVAKQSQKPKGEHDHRSDQ